MTVVFIFIANLLSVSTFHRTTPLKPVRGWGDVASSLSTESKFYVPSDTKQVISETS